MVEARRDDDSGRGGADHAQRQQDGKKSITLISMVYRAVRASMSAGGEG